jgi:hypothetical protein
MGPALDWLVIRADGSRARPHLRSITVFYPDFCESRGEIEGKRTGGEREREVFGFASFWFLW